jgi:glycosyltransferase involved in cell wall biosynthesis
MDRKQMRKVSVVLPTYNCAVFLDRAIQSVLNQTYKNIELLIINDGSTDNTTDVLDKYKNLNNIKIFIQKNMGANYAWNLGAQYATGEYLLCMECDVILDPTLIEREVDLLEEKPGISYVYCDFKLSGQMEGVWQAKPFNIDDLLEMNYINCVSVMRKKHFPGFDPKIKGFRDWDVWLTMYENGHVGEYMPGIYFEAIQRANGLSHDVHLNWNQRVLDIYAKHKRVAIFTLTKDRIEYTKRMFDALEKKTHRKYDHYIVDQGSIDGTVDYLKTRLGKGEIKKLILNNENTGISHGSNQALDAIGNSYDYIIKLDNDCEILTDDWLSELIKILVLGNNQAVLSPFVDGLVQNKGGTPRIAFHQVLNYQLGLTYHLGGISIIAPASAYENFRFNEKDFMSGQQDVSFSNYVQSIGYVMAYVEDIKVMHMDTTTGQENKYPEYFQYRKEIESKTIYKK